MLSQSQMETLIAIRNREGTILSLLPKDILPNYIRIISDEAHYFTMLLDEIAFGNPKTVIAMLENDPTLLFHAATIEGPNGCISKHVTPYELALKSGDAELGKIIVGYLLQSENGQKEKKRIDGLYQPFIKNMDKPQPSDYNFDPLLNAINKSLDEDITAELHHKSEHESLLRIELEKFRQHFNSVMIAMSANTGMSFNYQDLIRAFEIYSDQYNQPKIGINYDKCDLFWRQVIGYIQRGLPAVDRQVFAQGLFGVVQIGVANKRSFKFATTGRSFRSTSIEDHHHGLGYGHAIGCGHLTLSGPIERYAWYGDTEYIKTYVQQKQQALLNLCALNTVKLKMGL